MQIKEIKMDLKYFVKKLWHKVIYLVVNIVYLICLNNLNRELTAQNFNSSFELLEYGNYVAIKYFFIALILFLCGCILIYQEIRNLKTELEEFTEMLIAFFTIIVAIFLLFLIFLFINNPILRAILCSAFIVVGVMAAQTN